jgi:DNA-binding response OmpR family regulator
VRNKFHVLIVKGEPEIAELWEQALERAGYLVSCVTHASSALQRCEMDRIDAVIIVAPLCDSSGTALAQVIRERWPELHVLLLAGEAEAAHLAGDEHLQLLKGMTTRMLKKRLEQLLPYPVATSHQEPLGYRGLDAVRSAGRMSTWTG